MTLKTVRLELARCPEFPEGSSEFGYEILTPLTDDGHIYADGWTANADKCTVRRFWRHEDDENGPLVHIEQGWIFDYNPDEENDDEPPFRLDDHRRYVSDTEHDGVLRTFQIADVR